MGEQPAGWVTIACREETCPEQVTYQPQELPGLAYPKPGEPITVYLECPRGHVHPYQLTR